MAVMGLVMTWTELPPAVIKICVNTKYYKLGNFFFGIHMWQLTIFFFQSSFTPSYLTQQTLYSSKTISYNSHCSSNAMLLKECSYLTVPVVWAKVMEYQHSATERASLTPLQQSAQGTTSTWRWSRPRHVNVGAFLFTKCISHKQKSCHFWKLCFGNSHVWDNSHKS